MTGTKILVYLQYNRVIRQITTFKKVCVAFVFELQTLSLLDFSKINHLKVLKPKNKDHTNFYE